MVRSPQNTGIPFKDIQLLQQSSAQDSNGQPALTFTVVTDLWAQVQALTGREAFTGGQFTPEVNYRVTCRYDDVADYLGSGSLVKMWLLFNDGIGDHYFDIQAAIPRAEHRNQWVDLLCIDRVGFTPLAGGAGAGPTAFAPWQRYRPGAGLTGAIDGVNRVFSVPGTPNPKTTLVFWNGQAVTGFTIAGSSITVAAAPGADDTLEVYA